MQADLRDPNWGAAIVNHFFTNSGDDRHMPWAMVGIRPSQLLPGSRARIPTIACVANLCGLLINEQLTGRLGPLYLRNAPDRSGRTME
jgi:hypothetical protein